MYFATEIQVHFFKCTMRQRCRYLKLYLRYYHDTFAPRYCLALDSLSVLGAQSTPRWAEYRRRTAAAPEQQRAQGFDYPAQEAARKRQGRQELHVREEVTKRKRKKRAADDEFWEHNAGAKRRSNHTCTRSFPLLRRSVYFRGDS